MKNSETVKFLNNLPRFAGDASGGYKPGFERILVLLDELHHPENAFPCLHVAGTNGKGSTASMIASIASVAGFRTGLHTSPHLLHVTERMRVDGVPAPPGWLEDAVDGLRNAIIQTGASFYEAVFALSLAYFREVNVNLAVVEVGLGGRLDATNILTPLLSVITRIGLDHQNILGETLLEIATEKAGIIKPGIPVLLQAQDDEALQAIQSVAADKGAPLYLLDREVEFLSLDSEAFELHTPQATYDDILLDLYGEHQKWNAATAIRALELSNLPISDLGEAVRGGLTHVQQLSGLRGRNELIWERPTIVADVAHNSPAMIMALETMEERFGGVDKILLGLMQDKDVVPFARVLEQKNIPVSTVLIYSERAFDPEKLGTILSGLGLEVDEPVMDLFVALDELVQESAPTDRILLLGSHLVVAEAISWSDRLANR